MNKYGWLFLSMVSVLLITLISNEIVGLTASQGLDNNLSGDIALNSNTLLSYLNTYVGLLTFNVAGIPNMVSLLFIPLNLVIGFILLEIIIKAVEAIIPL